MKLPSKLQTICVLSLPLEAQEKKKSPIFFFFTSQLFLQKSTLDFKSLPPASASFG